MSKRLIQLIPGIQGEELVYIKNLTRDLNDDQLETFAAIYNGKRKKEETVLIATILGFIGVAGVQRFLLDQILLGLIYFFTGGLCLIGTIIDLVNYKRLTFEYNQHAANDSVVLVKEMD
ncbi:MAG: TM2 domain-containing protein [Candidatus Cyclobacteriaceae bacterium M2_1C_046]